MQKIILLKQLLPLPISGKKEFAFLTHLNKELRENVNPDFPQEKNEEAALKIIYKTFKDFDLQLKYCGFYELDPENPEQTNPRPFNIGKGHGGITIYRGVIGKAVRNFAESIYVTNVKALEMINPHGHVACDSTMAGAEIVIAQPYILDRGTSNEKRLTRMTLDLDIKRRKNPFSDRGAAILEEICIPCMETTFTGPPRYIPIEGIHMTKELEEMHV